MSATPGHLPFGHSDVKHDHVIERIMRGFDVFVDMSYFVLQLPAKTFAINATTSVNLAAASFEVHLRPSQKIAIRQAIRQRIIDNDTPYENMDRSHGSIKAVWGQEQGYDYHPFIDMNITHLSWKADRYFLINKMPLQHFDAQDHFVLSLAKPQQVSVRLDDHRLKAATGITMPAIHKWAEVDDPYYVSAPAPTAATWRTVRNELDGCNVQIVQMTDFGNARGSEEPGTYSTLASGIRRADGKTYWDKYWYPIDGPPAELVDVLALNEGDGEHGASDGTIVITRHSVETDEPYVVHHTVSRYDRVGFAIVDTSLPTHIGLPALHEFRAMYAEDEA